MRRLATVIACSKTGENGAFQPRARGQLVCRAAGPLPMTDRERLLYQLHNSLVGTAERGQGVAGSLPPRVGMPGSAQLTAADSTSWPSPSRPSGGSTPGSRRLPPAPVGPELGRPGLPGPGTRPVQRHVHHRPHLAELGGRPWCSGGCHPLTRTTPTLPTSTDFVDAQSRSRSPVLLRYGCRVTSGAAGPVNDLACRMTGDPPTGWRGPAAIGIRDPAGATRWPVNPASTGLGSSPAGARIARPAPPRLGGWPGLRAPTTAEQTAGA